MTDSPVIHARRRPPKALEAAGRRLWRAVVSEYELRPDELIVLETACSCADLVAKLEAAMEGQPLVVKGSMGQEREHPLLSEQRQQRALLNRSLVQLKLPDVDGVDRGATVRSVAARRAAQSRWASAPWSTPTRGSSA